MYERLSKVKTANGVTLDKCIQPSVDNTGDITGLIGLVAGDPDCYEVPVQHSFHSILMLRISVVLISAFWRHKGAFMSNRPTSNESL